MWFSEDAKILQTSKLLMQVIPAMIEETNAGRNNYSVNRFSLYRISLSKTTEYLQTKPLVKNEYSLKCIVRLVYTYKNCKKSVISSYVSLDQAYISLNTLAWHSKFWI